MHSTNNILYFWFQTCYKLQPILDTSHPSSNKGYDCKFENNKDQFVAIVFIAHVSLVTSDQRKQTVNAFTSSKLYYLHKEARFDEANWLLNEWPHPDFFSCLVSVATRTETDGASSPYHLFIITQEREGANKTQNVMFGFMPSQAKQGVQGNQMSKCVLSSPATDLNMGQLTCARPISVLLNVSRTQKRAQKKNPEEWRDERACRTWSTIIEISDPNRCAPVLVVFLSGLSEWSINPASLLSSRTSRPRSRKRETLASSSISGHSWSGRNLLSSSFLGWFVPRAPLLSGFVLIFEPSLVGCCVGLRRCGCGRGRGEGCFADWLLLCG